MKLSIHLTAMASLSMICAPPVAGLVGLAAAIVPAPAQAARCTLGEGGGYACSMVTKTQSFRKNVLGGCYGPGGSRSVTYQVPEGTPPAGGWPVIFFYNGTMILVPTLPDGPTTLGPILPVDAQGGSGYLPEIFHEFLDDPAQSGKKYAVVYPQAATQLAIARFWDTNVPLLPYNLSSDYCFLPALWQSIESGDYGAADQFDMNRRFAFGMSSGGYNTSRMAVSWNGGSVWKALAIQSASYATCLGPVCVIPNSLPANHPPTKFYHGTADTTVPISTMYAYYDKLIAQNHMAAVQTNGGGHALTPDLLGPGGVKAWFDQY